LKGALFPQRLPLPTLNAPTPQEPAMNNYSTYRALTPLQFATVMDNAKRRGASPPRSRQRFLGRCGTARAFGLARAGARCAASRQEGSDQTGHLLRRSGRHFALETHGRRSPRRCAAFSAAAFKNPRAARRNFKRHAPTYRSNRAATRRD
jgi:hypothetical protein